MAASFLALARKKVKPKGRIGFVLPLTAAFADTWTETRRLIEREFDEIIAIVVSSGQALGKDALSADTGMEEMLLVATYRETPAQNKKKFYVNCVTLNSPVTRLGEAGVIARSISLSLEKIKNDEIFFPITVGESEVGQTFAFKTDGNGDPWGPLGVIHTELAVAAEKLKSGKFCFLDHSLKLKIKMTTLDKLFEIGPTHDLIGHPNGGDGRGAFEFFPVKDSTDAIGSDRSLWAANGKYQRSLIVFPTHKGNPVPGGEIEKMRSQQGRLFYARNMRWTSQALLAATTNHDAMGGSSWTALLHNDIRVCKCFALWANSIFGMLIHWTRGQRTHSGRSRTQIGALSKMPCPRLNELGEDDLNYATKKFDELSPRILKPACQSHADETRKVIDSVIIDILQLNVNSSKEIEQLRDLWCREPSVHGGNQKALSLFSY